MVHVAIVGVFVLFNRDSGGVLLVIVTGSRYHSPFIPL